MTEIFTLQNILVILGAYLFGSIPWALVIGKVFYKTDVREHGSGNLGGSNAGRVLGKKAGISVTILDALKSTFTVLICSIWFKEVMIIAGLAVCFGHCFPIFAKFKGGKAVATTMGYFLGVGIVTGQFLAIFLLPIAIFFGTLYLCKMVSLSSMIAIGIEAIVSFFIQPDMTLSLSFVALFLFVTYRHKSNIKRIMNHEEKKITWM
ncbi:MAG: glycerol-3-phosphate 1-O-acyltransferase PlsY [Longicatena sp.]|jgi:acyl phosphate:glycerol-3-phosphate acyltransferase|uniref:glycerol-3-phosphate 1-O-acyltransferase PlsY n=1 Tax=Anaerorhabdus sp. TaxID=1872524 RepID=UPI002FCA4E1A